jgi:hypothetical protein
LPVVRKCRELICKINRVYRFHFVYSWSLIPGIRSGGDRLIRPNC